MKNISKILLVISLLCILVFPGMSQGSTSYVEKIDSYDVNIEINSDSSILVTEKIEYDFGMQDRHGIYRYIPYKYKARGGNFSLRFSDFDVIDEKGNRYKYETSKQGDNIYLKIGDPNVYISGKHIYLIKYKVERALNYFADWDELYWNVTGTEWQVPIVKSSVTVALPHDIAQGDLKTKCFTGSFGSTEEDCTVDVLSQGQIKYSSDVEFNPYEGFTIVLGWPKQIVAAPSWGTRAAWIIGDNISLFIAPLVFLLVFLYWYYRGRDPKIEGPIVAEYEAPENLSPIELGALTKDKVVNKYISAQLVQLAIKGYLKIIQTGEGKKDYKFVYRKDYNDLENDYDKRILEYVFDGKQEVAMGDLENKFYQHINKISNLIYQSLTEKKYYVKNPQRARFGTMFVVGVLLLFMSFILGSVFVSFTLGASIFISAIIMIVFSQFMSKKTKEGAEALRKIFGFKKFLEVTEEERLKFHNPPEMVPEVFEKFLPYAMILGVENKWAKNFEKIYTQKPDWYEGHQVSAWSSVYLANSLSTFSSYSSSVMASAPSSSASGGSGFSGGGSGGGGGGGGGGSW